MTPWKREEVIGDCRLLLGDAKEIMPMMGRPVDCVVTSPPYAEQRDYGGSLAPWRENVSEVLKYIPASAATQVLVNLGLIHKDGEVFTYWNDLIADMRTCGWKLFGWYVWDKIDGMGGDWAGRLAPSHEWVLHFNRRSRPANKTFHCKTAGRVHNSNPGVRRPDGTFTGYSHEGRKVQTHKIPDSVLRIYAEHTHTQHPAVFPVLLPRVLVDTYSDANETVLDPFMGSGTTGVACVKLGRKFIGIEIEEKYFDIAVKRIRDAYAQPDFFVEPHPQPAKQEAMF